jgi:hypothetical protein
MSRHKGPRVKRKTLPGGRKFAAALAIFSIGPLFGQLYAADPHFITDFIRRIFGGH